MLDIDLYEFKGKIKEFQAEKIEFCQDKGAAIIEVGKAGAKIDKRLRQMGCKDGQRVLVVVQ